MDHHYLAEHQIIARYLMGKLSAAERIRFEEHYIDCAACLDRLEVTEACWRELQIVAAEPSPTTIAHTRFWPLGRWTRSWWQPPVLIATVGLLIGLPLLVWLTQRRAQQASEQSKIASIQPSPASSAGESPTVGEKPLPAEESRLTASPPPSKTQLLDEQDQVSKRFQPQINIPIFDLSAAKRGANHPSDLIHEIRIPDSPGLMIFSLELEEAIASPACRATITTAGGNPIWQQSGLHPNADDTLTISFPSRYFRPGDYLLTLEGISPSNPPVTIASYPFRVSKKKSENKMR